MKKCSRCKQIKKTEAFAKNNTRKDGLSTWCRDCYSKHHQEHRPNSEKRLSFVNVEAAAKMLEQLEEDPNTYE